MKKTNENTQRTKQLFSVRKLANVIASILGFSLQSLLRKRTQNRKDPLKRFIRVKEEEEEKRMKITPLKLQDVPIA